MTLDERVRAGLRRSADAGRLDEDEVFDQVQTAYKRGRVRTHVLRQATTVAIVLTLIAGIGVFISWRAAPERYRTTAAVAVGAGVPGYSSDPRRIALAPKTRRATLLAAHAAPEDTRIGFLATSLSKRRLSLAVTATSRSASELVTRQWVAVLARARTEDATHRIRAARLATIKKVEQLHNELRRIDAKLIKMDPIVYGGVQKFDSPNGNLPSGNPSGPPPVPEQGTVGELNLAFERIQVLQQIVRLGSSGTGGMRLDQVTPATISTRIVGPTATNRVSHTPAATWIALSGWFVALVLVLIGSVFIYRRRASSAPATGS